MSPTVTVIIPTYNHRDHVLATIESVFAQTFTDWELIVVNDASPDDTATLLKPLADGGRLRYIEQANSGVAGARNRGLQEARGEFVALLDDDDLWPADKLQWQVDVLRNDAALAGVGGELWHEALPLPTQTIATGPAAPIVLEDLFLSCPFASPGQLLFRRAAIEAVGRFTPEVWGVDDYDLYLKLALAGQRMLRVPRVALYYRVHATNASHQSLRMFLNSVKCVELRLADAKGSRNFRRLRRNAHRWAYNYRGGQIIREGGPMEPVLRWGWPMFLRDPWMTAKLLRDLAVRATTLGR